MNESIAGADASVEVPKLHNIKLLIASFYTQIDINNESIAGADASVEVPKLHNIKLLASFYTHIDYNYHDKHF